MQKNEHAASQSGAGSPTWLIVNPNQIELRANAIELISKMLMKHFRVEANDSIVTRSQLKTVAENYTTMFGYEATNHHLCTYVLPILGNLAQEVSVTLNLQAETVSNYLAHAYFNTDTFIPTQPQALDSRRAQFDRFVGLYRELQARLISKIKQIKGYVSHDKIPEMNALIQEKFREVGGDLLVLESAMQQIEVDIFVTNLAASQGISREQTEAFQKIITFYDKIMRTHFSHNLLNEQRSKHQQAYETAVALANLAKDLRGKFWFHSELRYALETVAILYDMSSCDLNVCTHTYNTLVRLAVEHQELYQSAPKTAFQYVHKQFLILEDLATAERILANQFEAQRKIVNEAVPAPVDNHVLTTVGLLRLAANNGYALNPKKSRGCYEQPDSNEAEEFYHQHRDPKKKPGFFSSVSCTSSCCNDRSRPQLRVVPAAGEGSSMGKV
jgi:hypothetical protein